MIRYLLDSNVLSEPARPRPDPKVVAALRRHRGELATPSVVWHELRYGVARLPEGRRKRRLTAYLRRLAAGPLQILPYDQRAAEWHANARARLVAEGRTPPFVDSQIAAVAVTRGLVFVTRNGKDFAGFEELAMESWFTRTEEP